MDFHYHNSSSVKNEYYVQNDDLKDFVNGLGTPQYTKEKYKNDRDGEDWDTDNEDCIEWLSHKVGECDLAVVHDATKHKEEQARKRMDEERLSYESYRNSKPHLVEWHK